MIELAKKGKVNCIIVKDFSRFGRDYVELGNYLEQLFPFMGVRFISVNDNYDSAELADGTTGGLDVAFKNLIYDYYSREMSKKQRIAWQRMAEQGQYNSNCALYGYRKSEEDKHKLVIEPEEAAVVKEIFDMKNCGCCGRALFNAHYGTIFCKQRSFKTDSDCRDIEINKHDADMAVLASVKREAEIFLDHDKLSRQAIKRNSPLSVSDRINATMRSIEAAQKSWIALYDKYADGKLEREFFLNEKKQYDADMEKMEEELAALRQAQEEEETKQQGSERKADQAMAFLEEEELTEDMKEKLIEKVIVYPGTGLRLSGSLRGV